MGEGFVDFVDFCDEFVVRRTIENHDRYDFRKSFMAAMRPIEARVGAEKIGYIEGVLLLLRSNFMPNSVALFSVLVIGAVGFGLVRMVLDIVKIYKNPVDHSAELEFYRQNICRD